MIPKVSNAAYPNQKRAANEIFSDFDEFRSQIDPIIKQNIHLQTRYNTESEPVLIDVLLFNKLTTKRLNSKNITPTPEKSKEVAPYFFSICILLPPFCCCSY
jgi:hypothetical protein